METERARRRGAETAFDLDLYLYRLKHATPEDPWGARACQRKRIRPMLRFLETGLPPATVQAIGSDNMQHRAQTKQAIESHCRVCGLCSRIRPPE